MDRTAAVVVAVAPSDRFGGASPGGGWWWYRRHLARHRRMDRAAIARRFRGQRYRKARLTWCKIPNGRPIVEHDDVRHKVVVRPDDRVADGRMQRIRDERPTSECSDDVDRQLNGSRHAIGRRRNRSWVGRWRCSRLAGELFPGLAAAADSRGRHNHRRRCRHSAVRAAHLPVARLRTSATPATMARGAMQPAVHRNRKGRRQTRQ